MEQVILDSTMFAEMVVHDPYLFEKLLAGSDGMQGLKVKAMKFRLLRPLVDPLACSFPFVPLSNGS